MIKRILTLIATITTTLSLSITGCSYNIKPTPEIMKDKALEYLNSMYDDNFTSLSYTGSNWAYSHATVIFSSEKYPGETVEVQVTEDNGKYTFSDNYFRLSMLEDAEQYFENIVKEQLTNVEIKVRFFMTRLPKELLGNAKFDELIKTQECHVEVLFISTEMPLEEQQEIITNTIAENNIMGIFQFIKTTDDGLFSECTVEEILTRKYSYISEIKKYSIDQNFDISKR